MIIKLKHHAKSPQRLNMQKMHLQLIRYCTKYTGEKSCSTARIINSSRARVRSADNAAGGREKAGNNLMLPAVCIFSFYFLFTYPHANACLIIFCCRFPAFSWS